MARNLLWFVPAGLAVGILSLFAYTLQAAPKNDIEGGGMVGQPVPAFALAGYNKDHPGLATADLKQGKAVMVNVFGTWCPPCLKELPTLKKLAAEHGATIHAIAYRDTPQALDRTFSRLPNPFQRIGIDPQGKAVFALGVSGAPETFIVDGKGVIRLHHVGEIRPEQIPAFVVALESAAK